MNFAGIRAILLLFVLLMLTACVTIEQGPLCMNYLPEYLSKASDQIILSSNIDPEQMYNFNKCRANNDDEAAQYRLGLNFEEGKGVKQSYRWATHWYKEAGRRKSGLKWRYGSEIATNTGPATPGHPIAQFRLGMMYLDGRGHDQSDDLARLWLGRSAAQGYEPAVTIYKPLRIKGEQQ